MSAKTWSEYNVVQRFLSKALLWGVLAAIFVVILEGIGFGDIGILIGFVASGYIVHKMIKKTEMIERSRQK